MIFTSDGRKIKPLAGFVAGWTKVDDSDRPADAVASGYTYQDWEPLESMKSPTPPDKSTNG